VRRALVLAALVAAVVAVPAAHATNECRGLMVCVPIAGPWVLAPSAAAVQYDLTCPRGYVVAGLDAELSARGIDIGFIGALGSPVNPGITTKRDAVFVGRLVRGRPPAASFRPHIGCVPASGAGRRAPTAYNPQAIPRGETVDRQVREVPATPSRTVRARCPAGERLTDATHAIGFYAAAPPSARAARAVHVTQRIRNGVVSLTIRSTVQAVVQLDLICVAK
jgi:hypothetical protein